MTYINFYITSMIVDGIFCAEKSMMIFQVKYEMQSLLNTLKPYLLPTPCVSPFRFGGLNLGPDLVWHRQVYKFRISKTNVHQFLCDGSSYNLVQVIVCTTVYKSSRNFTFVNLYLDVGLVISFCVTAQVTILFRFFNLPFASPNFKLQSNNIKQL